MFRKPHFFGSTTVNERGQIVLPSDLRKEFEINAGDKLVVLGNHGKKEHSGQIILLKSEFLTDILQQLELGQSAIRKFLEEEEKTDSK